MSFETEISTKEKFQNLIDICKSNFQMTDDEAKCFYIMMNRYTHQVDMGKDRVGKGFNELPTSTFDLSRRFKDWEDLVTLGYALNYRNISFERYIKSNNAIAEIFLEPTEAMLLNQMCNFNNIPKPPSKLTMAKIFKFYKDSEMPMVKNSRSMKSFEEHKFFPIYKNCEQIIAEHEQQKISQVFQNGTPGSGVSKPKRRM
ncbi:hypothetical protein DOI81_22610 [Salmonella enterica subsp. enterica serovar Gaminara]|nr:hypothetical protein [Salmonella enterica subsp. enterica serovar Gaminara]